MSPATRTALRLLKDDVGRYLLQDDITAPFGTTLLGKPVYVSDNMPDMAAGKTAIFYGDIKGLATKFSEDINIEVLREKYADEHAIGVISWFEFDAKVEDAQKIAKLVMAGA
ncbi:MAG: phage major capsid protein [Alphaproteobacteria bacterium]|nr:phage major capsid protein [Alphaproteobacteria bacterium]